MSPNKNKKDSTPIAAYWALPVIKETRQWYDYYFAQKAKRNANKKKNKNKSKTNRKRFVDSDDSENDDDDDMNNNNNNNNNNNENDNNDKDNNENDKIEDDDIDMSGFVDDGGMNTSQAFAQVGLWCVPNWKQNSVVWRIGVGTSYAFFQPSTNPCHLEKEVEPEYYDDGSILPMYDGNEKSNYLCKKPIGNGATMFMHLTEGHCRWKQHHRMKWLDVDSVHYKQFLYRCKKNYSKQWYKSKLTKKQAHELTALPGGYHTNFDDYYEHMERLRRSLLWHLENCKEFMTAIWTQYNTDGFTLFHWPSIPPMPIAPDVITKKSDIIDIRNLDNQVVTQQIKYDDPMLAPGTTAVPYEFIQVCGRSVVRRAEHPKLFEKAMRLAEEVRQAKYVLLSIFLLCMLLLSMLLLSMLLLSM